MPVDYNKIAKTFSNSRKKMKWEEIDYFISNHLRNTEGKSFLDVGCGSGRLLEQFSGSFDISKIDYLGLDLSSDMLIHAKESFPDKDFQNINMLDLDKIEGKKFDYIFFIASFHHLENFEYRKEVLEDVKNLIKDDGTIFMTNWSLDSEMNHGKYKDSIIDGSHDEFGSLDYKIKIGEYNRFYHGFSLNELNYLFEKCHFKIIENREFDNKKNFISIIKKELN